MTLDVGARLQTVRKSKGISQRELAKRVGVTNSTISLIEQNRVSPSVGSLKKVLDGIPMTLAEFFTIELSADADHCFYSREDQPDLGQGGLQYFLIGADHHERKMTVMREVLQPGSDSGEDLLQHEGEEGGVVVRGKVEVTVDNTVRVLEAGEGYYFDSRRPHRFRNIGDEEAEIVSANTPASF